MAFNYKANNQRRKNTAGKYSGFTAMDEEVKNGSGKNSDLLKSNSSVTKPKSLPTIAVSDDATKRTAYTDSGSESKAEQIRKNVQNTLYKSHSKAKIDELFKNLTDADIEDGIGLADKALNMDLLKPVNSQHGKNLSKARKDGLSMFYAAELKGLKEAAKLARQAAYAEESDLSEPSVIGNAELFKKAIDEKSSKINKYTYLDSLKDDLFSSFENPAMDATQDKQKLKDVETKLENAKNSDSINDLKSEKSLYQASLNYDMLRSFALTRLFAQTLKNGDRRLWNWASSALRLAGLKNSADLLEHSLQENPKDLVFYDDSDIATKIKDTAVFKEAVNKLLRSSSIEDNILGKTKAIQFTENDLHFGLNNCTVSIEAISTNKDGTKKALVHIHDVYDYTKYITLSDSNFFGYVGNNLAVNSTKNDAINPYNIDIFMIVEV